MSTAYHEAEALQFMGSEQNMHLSFAHKKASGPQPHSGHTLKHFFIAQTKKKHFFGLCDLLLKILC